MSIVTDIVAAIDPGRFKCGIAVVHKKDGVKYKTIVNTDNINDSMHYVLSRFPDIKVIVVGNGTTARALKDNMAALVAKNELEIHEIDEKKSTDEARQKYWEENPPSGLMRFIPLGMQSPPRPVDDYVAVILAERFFQKKT